MTALARVAARLVRGHSVPAARAALLEAWFAGAGLAPGRRAGCPVAEALLEEPPAAERAAALAFLRRAHPPLARGEALSLKALETSWETLVAAPDRRARGVVYTPDSIIDALLRSALEFVAAERGLAASPGGRPRICDPACGCGGFLVRAVEWLRAAEGGSRARLAAERLAGFDVDPQAPRWARCLLELHLALHGEALREPPPLLTRDVLLAAPAELLADARAAGGFDVVATNPPYIRLQSLPFEYRKLLSARHGERLRGAFSAALLFLWAGRDLLAPGGCLAYVTQNNLFTSLAARPARRLLQRERAVRRVIDFGAAPVFERAAAYACLLFVGNTPRPTFEYAAASPERLAEVVYTHVAHDALDERQWRLAEGRHLDNLHRLSAHSCRLRDVAAIHVGFATLKDEVFLTRQRDGFAWAREADGARTPIELAATRPAIKVADLRDERDLAGGDLRVIFPYRPRGAGWEVWPEDDLRRECPAAHAYLLRQRRLLDQRDAGRRAGQPWHAWGRAQGRSAPGPKLLTKTFAARPGFWLDATDRLFCNGYSVGLRPRLPDAQRGLDLPLLRRLLNSPLMHYFTLLTSVRIRGGFQCYQKNFIERFPLPPLDPELAARLRAMPDQEFHPRCAALLGVPWEDVAELTRHDSPPPTK